MDSRRRKFAGYLRAANELRQSWSREQPRDDLGAVVRSGDEEMVLFPSYAKSHTRSRPEAIPGTIQQVPGSGRDSRDAGGDGDAEFWKQQWEQYENDKAVVDVDVRGWIYAPHSGQLSRKHRLMVGMARQLVGIAAPGRQEDITPPVDLATGQPARQSSAFGAPADMSQAELVVANERLMSRLKPFMSAPLANTTISAFFYNDQVSRQRTINTNAAGHFSIRAALDFVPTHVRLLAGEKLSFTEQVQILPTHGVSLISDIDDTIKHSSISSGAREIFRNAFIRDLSDLTIDGVKEWYNKLAYMGVSVHYVSNSPWQVYPMLTKFFSLSGLPPGSFHLKQYSGMLQGIFEPVAERKKGTLERILADFPDRQFILVGDSGEADLEVYTDVVLEYPGRVLGIFIRDVTTPVKYGFFDSSLGPLASKNASTESLATSGLSSSQRLPRSNRKAIEDAELEAAIVASLKDLDVDGTKKTLSSGETSPSKSLPDLMDFGDDEAVIQTAAPSEKNKVPPKAPPKPANLRATPTSKGRAATTNKHVSSPLPLSRAATSPIERTASPVASEPASPAVRSSQTERVDRSDQQTYRQKISAVYGALPSPSSVLGFNQPAAAGVSSSSSQQETNPNRKLEMWKRRWTRAKGIMDSKGVLLRTWRVGGDVEEDCIRAVTRALEDDSRPQSQIQQRKC